MIQKLLLTVFIILTLSNCTPARLATPIESSLVTEKITIKRQNKMIYLLLPEIFGYDNRDMITLSNGQEKIINVPIGQHEFFVRSNQADRPYKLVMDIEKGKTTCLITYPETKNLVGKILLPPLFWTSNAFVLEQAEC
ncbi:MAG: hypothetical protein HON23_02090 [Rickettsiales bacterium]|jgi:hypothetical protein|nr:hypothetical protein [Rickettsiales bacterium]